MKSLLAVSLILFLSIKPAVSCDCIPATTVEYYKSADVIFTGKVMKVIEDSPFWSSFNYKEDPEPITLVQIEITDNLKGLFPKLKFITIPLDYSSCQYHFTEGEEYLVFGRMIVSNPGIIMTSDCMGNQILKENNKNILNELRKLKAEDNSDKKTLKKDLIQDKVEISSNSSLSKTITYIVLVISLLLNIILVLRNRKNKST
jgi:hypothetical protein